MKRILATSLLLGVCSIFGLMGCAEEAKETVTHEVSTPEGSKTVTSETKVETTGDVPPPSSPATPAPAPQ